MATSSDPFAAALSSAQPMPPQPTAVLKLHMRGETFRLSLPVDQLYWENVVLKVNECLAATSTRPPALWALVYTDNEGDLVTILGADEFQEALHVFTDLQASNNSERLQLQFHVVAKTTLREQLAPVLHLLDEISGRVARIATETRESLRRSTYVERGRESLYSSAVLTRESLVSVGRGISQRVHRASVVVADELASLRRRARTRSRFASQDEEEEEEEGVSSPETLIASSAQDPLLNSGDVGSEEDSDTHVATLLAQARAATAEDQDGAVEENEVHDDQEPPAVTATTTAEPAAEVDVLDHANDHASDAETASTASEDAGNDWDFVRASGVPALSPYAEEEDDDEMEITFSRWPEHVRAIREIMPSLSLVMCTDVLDKHNGDLEAALIELTEL